MKEIPVLLITIFLIISGMLKITSLHPMTGHFVAMGLGGAIIKLLGAAEITFSVLFIYPATRKIGLLLLTAYFGGAIAVEVPYHQVVAPLIPLAFVWIAAFLRQPSDFGPIMSNTISHPPTAKS